MSRVVAAALAVILVSGIVQTGFGESMGGARGHSVPHISRGVDANGNETSSNWSGYAVSGAAGSVTDVIGSWIVPEVSCSAGDTSYSAFWVGIDGFNSSTVEQTGTDSDCADGTPSYYAWYEFYPQASEHTPHSIGVGPGDIIQAEVQYDSADDDYVVTINNISTGESSSETGAVSGADRSSAEWIVEAPAEEIGRETEILPLADFGTAQFGQDNTQVSGTCYATVSGTSGSIGSFGSAVTSINMTNNSGTVESQPAALSSDGTSFSVSYQSASSSSGTGSSTGSGTGSGQPAPGVPTGKWAPPPPPRSWPGPHDSGGHGYWNFEF